MRIGYLIGPDLRDLLQNNPEELQELLEEFHPEDLADLVDQLPEEIAAKFLKKLPAEDAAEIFERLEDETQEALVEQMGPDSVAQIAAEMAPDDRVELLEMLPEQASEAVLQSLERVDPEAAEEVAQIEKWPEQSAGRLMTTNYVSVPHTCTVGEAMKALREAMEAETIYYVYAVTAAHRLHAVASLRDLLRADPEAPLSEVATENVISVPPTMDQEDVARRMAKYDLMAMPVMDERGAFLGIITVDDVIDVLTEEQSEDVQKLGGIEPIDAPYFATSFLTLIRKRAFWLLALFIGEFFTGTALRAYDKVLEAVTTLSFYVPLLISTGGNSGGQSSSLIIRGMAVGEIKMSDWWRVLGRETLQGIVLGVTLAVVGVGRVLIWGDGVRFALVIGVTLIGIVIMGCTVGAMLPFLLKRIGFDPATSSAPFIASLVDVLGILIYFNVAKILLREVIERALEGQGHALLGGVL
ncbi:MAG: magnesium transporter [Myxococcales bacterium]|nr:magnesium transporter [Polyangiaceae bacterium]MDW8250244.1 magnesium transporter [Myxococcales bacterium]